MADEDERAEPPSLPEVFRRVLERLDRRATLPPGVYPRILGPGSMDPGTLSIGEREPATEILQTPETVYVTIELPGATREDIDLRSTETTLSVSVNSAARRYYREIALPAPVRVDMIKATYKNGVLDIALEKRDKAWRIPVN